MSKTTDYKKEIMDAAHNERIKLALSRAIASYRKNTNAAIKKFPHTIKLAEEVQEKKKRKNLPSRRARSFRKIRARHI